MKRGEKLEETKLPRWLEVVTLSSYTGFILWMIGVDIFSWGMQRIGGFVPFDALIWLFILGALPATIVRGYDISRQLDKFMVSYRVMLVTTPFFLLFQGVLLALSFLLAFEGSVILYALVSSGVIEGIVLMWMVVDLIRRDVWPWWTFKYPRK